MGARFPWLFLGLTYGLSWAIWVPYILSGKTVNSPVPSLIIACSVPSLVGILLTHLTSDSAGRVDFWKRVVSFKLIGLRWYAVIICLFPFLLALGLLTDKLFGGALPPLRGAEQTLTQPAALMLFIGANIIGGPLGEELGWRGFALDRLQNKWNALVASLILGIIWTAWHFPLFLYQRHSSTRDGIWHLSFLALESPGRVSVGTYHVGLQQYASQHLISGLHAFHVQFNLWNHSARWATDYRQAHLRPTR